MQPSNISRPSLALALPLCAALLGWSAAALASGGLGAPAVAFLLDSGVVSDQALLECRLRADSDALVVDLKIDGEWTATDNDIHDLISASNSLSAVTTRFQPEPGKQQRMRFKVHGSTAWGPWSAWTTSRIAHVSAVPGPGLANVDEFEAETRQSASQGTTVATHGYIRIKKLNSGG